MPRVIEVQRSQKRRKCDKCGKRISKGRPYVWWKFKRQTRKHYRCSTAACRPRQSELTLSPFWSQVYSIQESVGTAQDADDLESIMEQVRSAVESLKDELESSLDSFPDSLRESPTGELLQERIDACDEVLGNLDGISIEDCGKAEIQDVLDFSCS